MKGDGMKQRTYTFVVEGAGQFPVDMLRYDRCSPYASEDVHWCFASGTNRRSAMMVAHQPPTVARWASFGWTVDMVKEIK
jgi:hypothetical protein